MSNTKPLPDLPQVPPGTLSTQAQEHRARFIRYALKETPAATSESDREAWAHAFEASLDDLCSSVAAGDWLGGIKKRRLAWKSKSASSKRKPDRSSTSSGGESQDSAISDSSEPHKSALDQIRELATKPALPSPYSTPKHLVLCLTPAVTQASVLREDSGFDIIPSNVGFSFRPGYFAIHDADEGVTSSSILYGLDNWDDSIDVRLVGGTFTFRGTTSPVQHHALARVLRVCIFMHLSMLLEQHFLLDSGISLKFPRPGLEHTSSSGPPTPRGEGVFIDHQHSRNRPLFSPTGIFSFFSKKAMQRLHHIPHRGSSLDLGSRTPTEESTATQRSSIDSSMPTRIRRFSFLSSEPRPSAMSSVNSETTFSTALSRLESSREFLSTSPDVTFSPPLLLTSLAAKEQDLAKPGQGLKLKAEEKLGLTTVLGWDNRSRGEGMAGVPGFVLQQEISVLVSSHVPSASTSTAQSSADELEQNDSTSSLQRSGLKLAQCGKPEWRTYKYYEDESVGEVVQRLAEEADATCEVKGCQAKKGQHVQRLIHGPARITLSLSVPEQKLEGDDMMLWTSCEECDHSSDKHKVSDGTYMLSFGKFIELLTYSDRLVDASHCPHSSDRFIIRRHIRFKGYTFTVTMDRIEDGVFEIKAPRLQIINGGLDRLQKEADADGAVPDEKKSLRRQIRAWWESVAEFVDKLEDILTTSEGFRVPKHLPKLPSEDDAYEDYDSSPSPMYGETPSESSVPQNTPGKSRNDYFGNADPSPSKSAESLSESSSITPRVRKPNTPDDDTSTPTQSKISTLTVTPSTSKPLPEPAVTPLERLSTLRQTFHRTEQSLYTLLGRTPVASLNDVRRTFLSSARGAEKRLHAWQRKHLPSFKDKIEVEEPEWFGKACHVVPHGNIVVREDDWGSIIAFTMSTPEYQHEMANMAVARSASSSTANSPPTSPGPTSSAFLGGGGTVSSEMSTSTGGAYKFFRSSKSSQLDPDKEDVVWHEPEAYSAVISRKEHPRDPTGLMSIRDVLRSKSPTESGSGILSSSRFATFNSSNSRSMTPPSAWAKPDVQLSDVQVSKDGMESKMSGTSETLESDSTRVLHELDSNSVTSRPGSSLSNHSLAFGDARIRRGKAASLASLDSDATAGPASGGTVKEKPYEEKKEEIVAPAPTSSSFATFASGITQAMKLMLHHPDPAIRPSSPVSMKHGLLSTEVYIDDRPHIKYDWTIGKRLKFSCTVYYAKQFDNLRRRCGIDDVFLQSLSRSTNWAAEGGKSKSNFWKTADDRFIIKTLLNGWNVADLQVLIEIAPSYFRYMESTASRATVLAKLLGFYTVEIRNLESGTIQSKADLLVMENLFYERNIVKKFDLKGIHGRKVKASPDSNSKTLFDGDWIEGQQQTLTLVRPHSKAVFREAIRNDADFLAKSNIMDYSLLVGLDEEHKQIACGLVDTIGSYTFAKTLEYKAKQGLNAGKEVTVIPPHEYQERFVNALDRYFVACPDKWSRSLEDRRTTGDPNRLPSVF